MARILAVLSLLAACHETMGRQDEPRRTAGLQPDWRQRAAGYLDRRADDWLASPPRIANVRCALSCHTTFPTLLARTALAGEELPAARSDLDLRILAVRVAGHSARRDRLRELSRG